MNKKNENRYRKRIMLNDLILTKMDTVSMLEEVKKHEEKMDEKDKEVYANAKHIIESLDSPASYHNGIKLVSDFLADPLDVCEEDWYRMNVDKTFLVQTKHYLKLLKNYLIRK